MNKLTPLNYRPNEERLTRKRVEMVMRYVIYCYQKMVTEGKTYKKTEFQNENKTRFNLEERLSEKLVNDYLGHWDNKEYYKSKISNYYNVFIDFHCEPKQSYNDKNITKDDYIDIKVTESEISSIWGNSGEKQQIHLAIECKVIEKGYSEYVSDIQKMTERPFNTPRLSFEGQIAYIINPDYSHTSVFKGINKNLSSNKQIHTIQELEPNILHENFDSSYLSKHKRSHNNKVFSIYHLMLNYSKVVFN